MSEPSGARPNTSSRPSGLAVTPVLLPVSVPPSGIHADQSPLGTTCQACTGSPVSVTPNTSSRPSALVATVTEPARRPNDKPAHPDHPPLGRSCQMCTTDPSGATVNVSRRPSWLRDVTGPVLTTGRPGPAMAASCAIVPPNLSTSTSAPPGMPPRTPLDVHCHIVQA